jgi:hypothetical protein
LIAVDTNLLVYAHRRDSEWHEAAATCIRGLAEGRAQWAIPWPCVHEFLAIATHPRIYDPPTTVPAVLDQVDAWLESPTVTTIGETADPWVELRALIAGGRISGPRVHDARVAAICIAHGVSELWSVDRDFGRFAALVTRNPLAG